MKVSVLERAQASGKITFYLSISQNGKRIKEKLDFENIFKSSDDYRRYRQLAKTIASKRTLEIMEGKHDITISKKSIRALEFFGEYVKNYNRKDIRKAEAMEKYLKKYCQNSKMLSNLDEGFAEGFRDYLRENLSAESTRNYFNIFKKGVKSAVSNKLIRHNFAIEITVEMKGANQKRITKEVLTIDELKRLNKTHCPNQTIKEAFFFACNTGITLSELKCLEQKHVKRGKLHYQRHKTNKEVEVEVPLNENAQSIVARRLEGGFIDLLFPELPSTNGVNKTLGNWVKRAGIDKHITFYCSRHTFGTLQAERGVNQSVIAKNMGHQSTKYTDKYINHVDKAQEAAVQFETF